MYLIFVHYVFRQSGRDDGPLYLAHLGISWEYSMKFRFYEMKAGQEASGCCGKTCFRKLILKRYKQHALYSLLGERL